MLQDVDPGIDADQKNEVQNGTITSIIANPPASGWGSRRHGRRRIG